jgi:hypothetical protein
MIFIFAFPQCFGDLANSACNVVDAFTSYGGNGWSYPEVTNEDVIYNMAISGFSIPG